MRAFKEIIYLKIISLRFSEGSNDPEPGRRGVGVRQFKGIAMARGDQLSRQWKIIQTLISSRIGRSAADLAVELDINPRTVYRDLEALQLAGFPIYNDKVEGRHS